MIDLLQNKKELAPPIINLILNRRNVTTNFRNLQYSVGK